MSKKQSAGLMTQAEYARHRKVNRSHVSRLAKRGILILRGKLVDVAASDAVLDDRPVAVEPNETGPSAQPQTATETPGQQPTSYAQARLADMVYRAKLRRLDYEPRSGKLIPADEVKAKWFVIARQIRDRLLAIPSKLSPQLASQSPLGRIQPGTLLRDWQGRKMIRNYFCETSHEFLFADPLFALGHNYSPTLRFNQYYSPLCCPDLEK